MKKRICPLIPYLLVMFAAFYVLPFLAADKGMSIITLLLIAPTIAFVCAFVSGSRQGFNWLLPIISIILFAPTILLFYNLTAWVYMIAYGCVVAAGSAIGTIFHKKKE